MSSSSDNPFVRFTAFWWALGVFSLFGALLLVTKLFTSDTEEANPLEEAAAVKRYETRAAVDAAQTAGLGYKEVEKGKVVQVPPSVVFTHVGETLLAKKPEAVKQDTQIIPGGVAAKKKLLEGPVDPAEVDKLTPPADTPIDPAVMEAGKTAFIFCSTCHGPDGLGTPLGDTVLAPPLAGSEWVNGPVSNLIRIQMRGLMGPITVKGKEYNSAMAAANTQSDETIAAVLTYVRNNFGNKAGPVLLEQVKMLRSEAANPAMLSAQDLIKPTP